MRASRSALLIVLITITPARAGDLIPNQPVTPPEEPRSQAPPTSPRDSQPGRENPGMVKRPETIPHPDSVIRPPDVDPKMAIAPESDLSPSEESSAKPGEPQRKESR